MEWAFQMKRNYTVSYYTEFTCKLNPQSTIKIWALYNGFLQSYRPIVPVQSTVNLSHAHPLAFFLFLFQLNHPPLPLDIFPFLSFSFFFSFLFIFSFSLYFFIVLFLLSSSFPSASQVLSCLPLVLFSSLFLSSPWPHYDLCFSFSTGLIHVDHTHTHPKSSTKIHVTQKPKDSLPHVDKGHVKIRDVLS